MQWRFGSPNSWAVRYGCSITSKASASRLRITRGWKDVIVYLPHDGVATNNITGKRYIDHWTEAGFECGTPIKNTGAGAAMMRIEAARRVFPRCWFNESTTEAGRDALGYYHERQDEKRSIGLGPEHVNFAATPALATMRMILRDVRGQPRLRFGFKATTVPVFDLIEQPMNRCAEQSFSAAAIAMLPYLLLAVR
jgi:hypothetical protein